RQERELRNNAWQLEAELSRNVVRLRQIEADGLRIRNQVPDMELRLKQQFEQLTIRYNALAQDEGIKEALRELNADRKTNKLVLGPAADYNVKVKKSAQETLKINGMVYMERTHQYTWPSERALGGLVRRAGLLRDEVKPAVPPAELAQQRTRLVEQLKQ